MKTKYIVPLALTAVIHLQLTLVLNENVFFIQYLGNSCKNVNEILTHEVDVGLYFV